MQADPVQMLALRRWALRLLAGGRNGRVEATEADERGADGDRVVRGDAGRPDRSGAVGRGDRHGHAPDVVGIGAPAWSGFLRLERCALPLQRRLADARRTSEVVPSAGADAVRAAALHESRRALSAHANLELLASIAREHGWRLVVLKGGVLAASGAARIDVSDIDVLAPAGGEREVARVLELEGFRAHKGESDHHLAPRVASNALPVEVHRHLQGFDSLEAARSRIRPLDSSDGLWRLHPADHLWHVLHHAVVQHPTHRGVIRDLIALGHALDDGSSADLDDVEARIRAHAHAEPLGRMLDMARMLRAGRPGDPLEAGRFRVYVFAATFAALSDASDAGRVAVAGAGRLLFGVERSLREEVSRNVSRTLATRHWFPPIEWLRRRWMPGARAALRLGRALRLGASFAIAGAARVEVARWERRLRRR